ncbi:hypothetical protein [Nostoc sp.]|uniref:hypothetical protein n=1 Tax=Nostoc sp. TaxID=1180 RepID=UPI003FA55692
MLWIWNHSDSIVKNSSGSIAGTKEATKSGVFRVTIISKLAVSAVALVTASSKSAIGLFRACRMT